MKHLCVIAMAGLLSLSACNHEDDTSADGYDGDPAQHEVAPVDNPFPPNTQ